MRSFIESRNSEQTSAERYRQLFENAPIGIINVGLDGKPIMVNERAATTFGYASPQDFLDNVPSMLDLWVNLADRDRAAEIMLETGVLRDFEVLMRRRDGMWMTLSLSANPYRAPDGTVIGLQVSGIEVTDRVRAEQRLEEAQAQANITFWTWRLDTNDFVHTNELYDILGARPDDGPVCLPLLTTLVHPEDREMITMKLTTIKKDPGERFEIEFRIATSGGTPRWVIARGMVDAGGMQVSGSLQDITKQKLVEMKLTELNEMKTEFVGVVAHDLRTPLSVSTGYAEFLQEEWDDLDDVSRRRFLQKIQSSLDRLGALVADVSEVTRIESGSTTFDIQPFDLAALIRATVDEVSTVEADASFRLSFDEPLPTALGDRESIWRVLNNLLSNAVKYSPRGEPIAIRVTHGLGVLRVAVTDRGQGIAAIEQSKLFQKFSRLPAKGGEPRPPGTGLGLYICKSLIEGCGGSIWLESEHGKGSTFIFTLPVAGRFTPASPR